ncbi:sigma factor [Fodinicola acaciae]|uniref:sigma factor n=1 Tax=Fodinicola acaciae TaxID=2681555 RepID=UPI0013D06674|nr:sigma factor [Fodinicola acaciae]
MEVAIAVARVDDDRHEIARIHRDTYERLLLSAYALTGSRAEAQDAVQETFVRASRRPASVLAADSAEAWPRTVTLNICRSRYRRRQRLEMLRRRRPAEPDVLPGIGPERLELMEAIRRLPRPRAEAIALLYYHLLTATHECGYSGSMLLARTADAGRHWQTSTMPASTGQIVVVLDENTVIVGGLISHNGGATWAKVPAEAPPATAAPANWPVFRDQGAEFTVDPKTGGQRTFAAQPPPDLTYPDPSQGPSSSSSLLCRPPRIAVDGQHDRHGLGGARQPGPWQELAEPSGRQRRHRRHVPQCRDPRRPDRLRAGVRAGGFATSPFPQPRRWPQPDAGERRRHPADLVGPGDRRQVLRPCRTAAGQPAAEGLRPRNGGCRCCRRDGRSRRRRRCR